MVDQSWVKKTLDLDRSLKGMTISKIYWIQNPLRWKRYQQTKEFIRESQGPAPALFSITQMANYTPWMKHQGLDTAMNELLLFHGTSSKSINEIAYNGFDLRLSNEGYFGRGIYFGKFLSRLFDF